MCSQTRCSGEMKCVFEASVLSRASPSSAGTLQARSLFGEKQMHWKPREEPIGLFPYFFADGGLQQSQDTSPGSLVPQFLHGSTPTAPAPWPQWSCSPVPLPFAVTLPRLGRGHLILEGSSFRPNQMMFKNYFSLCAQGSLLIVLRCQGLNSSQLA